MMRGCCLWLLALLVALPSRADDFIVRDQRGRTIGTVEQGIGGAMVRRDASGRRIGTVEDGIGGQKILRDGDGRRTGTVEPGYGQEMVIRDLTGKRLQTIEPDAITGGYALRDNMEHRIGTVEKRWK